MKPTGKQKKYGSDVLVDLLAQQEIPFLSYNPGSSIAPFLESLANYHVPKKPELILCLHEEICVAIAHGYAKASGKPMMVAVHANVGLMHASMAIFNAWCDRVPMIVIGGIGPLDPELRRPWIDWLHSSNVQGNLVSNYVKWHDQPVSTRSAIDSLYRAQKITTSSPTAPVYISLSTTIQEEEIGEENLLKDASKYECSKKPQASDEDIRYIGDRLISSSFPVIVVDFMGNDKEVANSLILLAELMNIPVIDVCNRYNFPSSHSLCLTGCEKEVLSRSDFVLALDVQDLSHALGIFDANKKAYVSYLSPETKVVHVSMNDFLIGSWAADYQKLYPLDLSLAADSLSTVNRIYKYCCDKKISKETTKQRNEIDAIRENNRQQWKNDASQNLDSSLTVPSALLNIWEHFKNENFVITNCGGLTVRGWIKRLWEFNGETSSMVGISTGGAGLGYGLGASIGVTLAFKDSGKICVSIQNDGDFLYTPSALWTAAHYKIPLLIIVMNNGSYGLTKAISYKLTQSRERGYENYKEGHSFENPVLNFRNIATGFGLKTFDQITNIADLNRILPEAINYLKEYQLPVLVDVQIKD